MTHHPHNRDQVGHSSYTHW